MQINSKACGEFTVVQMEGRLDAETAADFETEVCGLLDAGALGFILDFQALSYISSIGLRAILTCAKKIKVVNGKLALCGLTGGVLQVIEMSGFDTFLNIFDTAEAAAETL